jgi:hypothetical protein
MTVMCAANPTSAVGNCKNTRGKSTMPRQQSHGLKNKRLRTKNVCNSFLSLCCLFSPFFADCHFDVQTIQPKDPCKYAPEGCKKSYKNLKDWPYYTHLSKVHHEDVVVTEPVVREMVSTSPDSDDDTEDDCEEHHPVPGPSREPRS